MIPPTESTLHWSNRMTSLQPKWNCEKKNFKNSKIQKRSKRIRGLLTVIIIMWCIDPCSPCPSVGWLWPGWPCAPWSGTISRIFWGKIENLLRFLFVVWWFVFYCLKITPCPCSCPAWASWVLWSMWSIWFICAWSCSIFQLNFKFYQAL